MRIKETIVYTFDELNDEAKERAIQDEINFLCETSTFWDAYGKILPEHKNSKLYKCWKKAEEMRTPWFYGSYVYEDMKDEVINILKINGYEFTEDGKFTLRG